MRPVYLLPMANCLLVWVLLAFGLRRPLQELAVAKYRVVSRSVDGPTLGRAEEIRLGLRPWLAFFVWPFLLILMTWIVAALVMG